MVYRSQKEKRHEKERFDDKRAGSYSICAKTRVSENAKKIFNTPAYSGLVSKRSDNNDKSSSSR